MKYFGIILFGILFSCGTAAFIETELPEIKHDRIEREILSENQLDTVVSSIEFDYYQLVDTRYKSSVNERVKEFVSSLTGLRNFENLPLTENFFIRALAQFESDYQEEFGAEISSGVWVADLTIAIDDHFLDFSQLSLSGWTYTGGAHGNGITEINYFSKGTGVKLNLTDLFNDVTKLNQLGEKYFRKEMDLTADADLNEAGFWFEDGKFYLSSNFYRDGDDFIFLFNQYEIAPYAAGVIEVSIPSSELSPLLRYSFD